MATTDLKEKLIERIRRTEDLQLLEEISRLFELQEPDRVYHVNDRQRKSISEAKEQIQNSQSISNEDANKDIHEWLNK
ncbi:MAG TPA: hypothetical protein VI385_07015 [Flavisolibacter sp.]